MKKIYTALGTMSGTSLDGVDFSIIQTDGEDHLSLIGNKYLEFSNNGLLNQQISLDIPAKDPLTDLQFTAKPDVKVMRSGFVWDSVNSWQHADSDNNGTLVINNEFLTADLTQQEIVYDFENHEVRIFKVRDI